MSPSPCLRRVRQLEDAGVIEKYVTILNRRALGIGILVYAEVKVPQVAGKKIIEDFEKAVLSEESIIGCYIMAGQFDFLLKVVARDMDHYSLIAQQVILRLPGVQDMRSSFVMNAIKDSTALPL
jgi:Lrp/AsnC family leucine-responsive transcriptional regulator